MIEKDRQTRELVSEKLRTGKNKKIKDLTRHWDDFVVDVATANDKVSTLWEVQKGTAHLNQLSNSPLNRRVCLL